VKSQKARRPLSAGKSEVGVGGAVCFWVGADVCWRDGVPIRGGGGAGGERIAGQGFGSCL